MQGIVSTGTAPSPPARRSIFRCPDTLGILASRPRGAPRLRTRPRRWDADALPADESSNIRSRGGGRDLTVQLPNADVRYNLTVGEPFAIPGAAWHEGILLSGGVRWRRAWWRGPGGRGGGGACGRGWWCGRGGGGAGDAAALAAGQHNCSAPWEDISSGRRPRARRVGDYFYPARLPHFSHANDNGEDAGHKTSLHAELTISIPRRHILHQAHLRNLRKAVGEEFARPSSASAATRRLHGISQ